MAQLKTGIQLASLVIPLMSGCLSPQPQPTCEPPTLDGNIDIKDSDVLWLDIVVPVPYSMNDDDLELEATWTFSEQELDEIRKLEYYGLSRTGYMGGPHWIMVGGIGVRSDVVTMSLPTVSSVHQIARSQEVEHPVLHMFVMFSAGEPTLTLQGHWNGTSLAYSSGSDPPSLLHAQDFQATSEDPTVVSAALNVGDPARLVALAFDARGPADVWLSPSYERPDGSSQSMKGDLLAEFSNLSGTWRFDMMAAGKVTDPERTIVWATPFNPAIVPSPEC